HLGGSAEVIVVDDDSPDGTWRLAQDLDDPRVKVIRRVGTRGLASAFNRGILESRGGIVGWMDADMCMPPAMLPGMVKLLDEYDVVVRSGYAPGGQDDRARLRVVARRLINRAAAARLCYAPRDHAGGGGVLLRALLVMDPSPP